MDSFSSFLRFRGSFLHGSFGKPPRQVSPPPAMRLPWCPDPLRADLSLVGLDSAWGSAADAVEIPGMGVTMALRRRRCTGHVGFGGKDVGCWVKDVKDVKDVKVLGMQLKNCLLQDEAECLAAVERVKLMTGCFLELTTTTDPQRFSMLRAVGGSTELSAVEPAFAEILTSRWKSGCLS